MRPLRPWRWVVLGLLVALLASCTPDLSESSAVVLVPTDSVTRSHWQFEPTDGPNNFHIFVHWDPSFNPDIDRSRTLIAYQVSDPELWAGADAENDQTARALQRHVQEPCAEMIDRELDIRSCQHDLGGESLTVTSRSFATTTGHAEVLVPGPDVDRAVRYLSDSFDEVRAADATAFVR